MENVRNYVKNVIVYYIVNMDAENIGVKNATGLLSAHTIT
jgi:hypothetical protein